MTDHAPMTDDILDALTTGGLDVATQLDAGGFALDAHGEAYLTDLEKIEAENPLADRARLVDRVEANAKDRWRQRRDDLTTASKTLDEVIPVWKAKAEAAKVLPDARQAYAANNKLVSANEWLQVQILDELRTSRIEARLASGNLEAALSLYEAAVERGDHATMRLLEAEVGRGLPSVKRSANTEAGMRAFQKLRDVVAQQQAARVPTALRDRVEKLEAARQRLRAWKVVADKIGTNGPGGQVLHRHGMAVRAKREAAAEAAGQ